MALTGKTIGELTALNYTTNNFLLPVEEAGSTYHIAFSGINYTEDTYSGLTISSSTGGLVVGQYYLMTDYQTCYDQPNYDNNGGAITTGNYKTGTTEPILLLATSTTGFSSTAYSTLYPKDKISYDFTWNTTEVTGSPAKGRITERIDDRNNRADYDFRAVQFIRYQAFFSEQIYDGTATIDEFGNVLGVGTDFTNDFSVGQILGLRSTNLSGRIGNFTYYEILTIADTTNMTVTGTTFTVAGTNGVYSRGISAGLKSPFQCNVQSESYTGSTEYYTFNENVNSNTYLGDNQDYNNNTFILSNNVFLSNGPYENMTFGGNVVGNTFDNSMANTSCGSIFQYNIITNNFDENTIGPEFEFNFIDCDMNGNDIGNNFQYNMLGDADGADFDYNQVGWGFSNNFLSFADSDFVDNVIGANFEQNLIDSGFQRNIIGNGFIRNRTIGSFNDNQISSNFRDNNIIQNFRDNVFGPDVYENNFFGTFDKNTGGPNFYGNDFYNNVEGNNLGFNFYNNNVGDAANIQSYGFNNNSFQGGCNNNTFTGATVYNKVGHDFENNTLATNFSYNQIGDDFNNNTIASDFGFGGGNYRGNVIGNGFASNNIGEYFYDNTIADAFNFNQVQDYFVNNKVSYAMQGSVFADLDSSGQCKNNNFTFTNITNDFTRTGGFGGNAILYTNVPTNIVIDAADNNVYVTFLSGGTITVQPIIN
jgi:hypothetical protein